MATYNSNDIFIAQRSETGSAFIEYVLHSNSSSFVVFDSGSKLIAIPTSSLTASYAVTASFAMNGGGGSGTTLATGSLVPITSSWAVNAINGGTSLSTGSTYPITSSWAQNAATSSLLLITQSFIASASWASSSISSSFATNAYTASFAINAGGTTLATGSLVPITASWAVNAINGGTQLVTGSTYPITASWSVSSSWAPQQQNISVNSITASYFSGSGEVIVPTPINPQDAATKQYVDTLSSNGIDLFFRSASSDIPTYFELLSLDFPLSASTQTISVTGITTNQRFLTFASRPIGITSIQQGNIGIRWQMRRSSGGSSAISVVPELYLKSGSVEYFLGNDTAVTLTTTNVAYNSVVTITSSFNVDPVDRIIIKFNASSTNSTPDIISTVDGNSSTGLFVAIPSSNFVLKHGDTMTGDLTAPGFTGSLFGTASWAVNAINGGTSLNTGSTYPITSSASITSSFAQNAATASLAATASISIFIFSNITQSFVISASWASSSISASYAPVEPVYSASVSTQFATKQNNLITGSIIPITASWAQTSSWAVNAINGGTQLVTGSTYPITSSAAVSASIANFSTSASWALTSYTSSYTTNVNLISSSLDLFFNVPFVVNTGSQQLFIDTSSLLYNPFSDTLNTHNITASKNVLILGSEIQGTGCTVMGVSTHAEGSLTTAIGDHAHSEGSNTMAYGIGSHAEGENTNASGSFSHAEGNQTTTIGNASHTEGLSTTAVGHQSHAEGDNAMSNGNFSHAEGQDTISNGIASHAEGLSSIADGFYAHAEGNACSASGNFSHAEGNQTMAIDKYCHAEGENTSANFEGSHTEGSNTVTNGFFAHAEGEGTNATGNASHTEGLSSIATGNHSHAEGNTTQTIGDFSHAEGSASISTGISSHAEGIETVAIGNFSHAEGIGTISSGSGQNVVGQYNSQNNTSSLFIIGNGTDDDDRSDLALFNSQSIVFNQPLSCSNLYGTASWAVNAINGGTSLSTGSTYPITASWSNNSISSSFTSNYVRELTTGSTYQITSSAAISSSFAATYPRELTTGSTYPITSSASVTSSYSLSSSYSVFSTTSSTASFATTVITASYALGYTRELTTGSSYQITSSQSVSSSYSLSSSYSVNSTTSATASFATTVVTASYASSFTRELTTGSTYLITSSFSNTASFVSAANVIGTVISASYAISASYSVSSSAAVTASSALSASNLALFNFNNTSSILNSTLTASSILSVPTASYVAAFFDYAVVSASNVRAGTIFGSWTSSGLISYTEVANTDIGNTSDITMSLGLGNGGVAQLSASCVTFTPWTIRVMGRYI